MKASEAHRSAASSVDTWAEDQVSTPAAHKRLHASAQAAHYQHMLCGNHSVCLQETAEADNAGLDFDGIYDLRALLKAVRKGRTLYPFHLHGVASTLEVRKISAFA